MGYRHLPQASRSSQAGTEDRGEDINRIEEEGRLNVSRGEFQLRMGLTLQEPRPRTQEALEAIADG